MCGRYVFVPGEGWVDMINQQKRNEPRYDLVPNYNVAPSQSMPVVTADGIELMKWGLVPSWAKEFKPAFTSINARSETAAEKPLYRAPFKNRRCLVPASGFYEWQQRETFKQPYLFTVKSRPVFYFAGLFDIWYDKDSKPRLSYSILTTEANELMSDVHNRMPVILNESDEEHWLDPAEDPDGLQLLLKPLDSNLMNRHEVNREVGNVKNNHEGLLLPLNSA